MENVNDMGFLRGFLAILFGILIIPILGVLMLIISGGLPYITAWESAIFTYDFNQIFQLIGQVINFDMTGTLLLSNEGLGIPLMSAWAVNPPGLIEALTPGVGIASFIFINTWKAVVWMCAGFFVGAIMSKATKGLLIALGLWIAWFVYNLLFAWIIIPIIGGATILISINLVPFLMNAILPLVIVIVAGAIGGAVVRHEEF